MRLSDYASTARQAWNVMLQRRTHPSAPALASSFSPSQNTAFTPPGPAFLIATFFIGFCTLQTYTCVSSEPDAQCCPSAVHASEWIRPLWNDQRDVTVFRSLTSYSTILPLDCAPSRCQREVLGVQMQERTYIAGSQQGAIWREGQGADGALVPFERRALAERLAIPRVQAHLLILQDERHS